MSIGQHKKNANKTSVNGCKHTTNEINSWLPKTTPECEHMTTWRLTLRRLGSFHMHYVMQALALCLGTLLYKLHAAQHFSIMAPQLVQKLHTFYEIRKFTQPVTSPCPEPDEFSTWPSIRSLKSISASSKLASSFPRTLVPSSAFLQDRLLRYRMLPPLLNWILPSSGFWRRVRRFKTDVSGLPIGPISKSQLGQLNP
jgi:hypothetical protein